MDQVIPLFKIHWDHRDVESVTSVIERGMDWAIGPEVAEFERQVADYVGVEHAIAVNSGTSALHAALSAHGIGEGDEVIVPSFTFIATANAPLFVGATPVFADIEEDTCGLDPEDVEKRITPRTRAIIPVHYGGLPCRIEELKAIARKHDLVLVEDAAESLGAAVNGKKVGGFGDSAILSFCAPKVITTGEGGMLLTDSRDVSESAKLLRSHGRADNGDYFSSTDQMEYVTSGYNFRMSSMTAALGIAQMGKIEDIIDRRTRNSRYLSEKLSGIEAIACPSVHGGLQNVFQLFSIIVAGDASARDELQRSLLSRRIMSKVYFHPVHLGRFYRTKYGYRDAHLPVTERMASRILSLPMYPTLTENEMDRVAGTVRDFFAGGAHS